MYIYIYILKLTSFICAGFKYRNFSYLKEIFKRCDIILLQETWLYNFKYSEFINILPNCQYHAISTMDESKVRRVGRPYGGCAILWHRNLALTITPVKSMSARICSVQVKSNLFSLVIINVYMPCDDNKDNNVCMYGDVLSEISSIISLYEDDNEIIVGGNFNVDYERLDSLNLSLMKQFVTEEHLRCATLPIVNNNYTRISSNGDKSFIDHILVSQGIVFDNVLYQLKVTICPIICL